MLIQYLYKKTKFCKCGRPTILLCGKCPNCLLDVHLYEKYRESILKQIPKVIRDNSKDLNNLISLLLHDSQKTITGRNSFATYLNQCYSAKDEVRKL